MANLNEAARELQAMTDALQDYIIDQDLYKTLTVHRGVSDDLIKMTLGGVLERIDALRQAGQSSDVVAAAEAALDSAKQGQTQGFYTLLAREAKSYADSWNWYLQRVLEGDEQAVRDYPQEVPIRLRLERLLQYAGGNDALAEVSARAASLDRQLKAIWQNGSSAYSDSGAYAQDHYWWLYGSPRMVED